MSDEGEPVTKAKKRKIAEIEFVEDDVEPLPEVVMDVSEDEVSHQYQSVIIFNK